MRQKYIAIVSLPYTEYSCKMASLLFDIVGAPSALCGSAHFSSDRALPHSTATFRRRKSNGARVSKMDQAYKRCSDLGDARSEAPLTRTNRTSRGPLNHSVRNFIIFFSNTLPIFNLKK